MTESVRIPLKFFSGPQVSPQLLEAATSVAAPRAGDGQLSLGAAELQQLRDGFEPGSVDRSFVERLAAKLEQGPAPVANASPAELISQDGPGREVSRLMTHIAPLAEDPAVKPETFALLLTDLGLRHLRSELETIHARAEETRQAVADQGLSLNWPVGLWPSSETHLRGHRDGSELALTWQTKVTEGGRYTFGTIGVGPVGGKPPYPKVPLDNFTRNHADYAQLKHPEFKPLVAGCIEDLLTNMARAGQAPSEAELAGMVKERFPQLASLDGTSGRREGGT